MATLEALRARIESAGDMRSVVSAMKVLAMVSIRQFEQSLASLLEAHAAVELGLSALLQERPDVLEDLVMSMPAPESADTPPHPTPPRSTPPRSTPPHSTPPPPAAERPGLLCFVFGSQQGLAGQFNEEISAFTLAWLENNGIEVERTRMVAMGEHVAGRLRSAGPALEEVIDLPATMANLPAAVERVMLRIGASADAAGPRIVMLFHHRSISGAMYEPQAYQIAPPGADWLRSLALRKWPGRSLPMHAGSWSELFSFLMREHLLVSVERAFADSLLSENSSRLLAMQVAERNIADHLDELTRRVNTQRQGQITTELIDIVAGAEALTGELTGEI